MIILPFLARDNKTIICVGLKNMPESTEILISARLQELYEAVCGDIPVHVY